MARGGNVRVRFGADTSELERGTRRAERSMDQLSRAGSKAGAKAGGDLKKIQRNVRDSVGAYAAFTAVTAGVTAGITKAATTAIGFDAAMRNVNSIAQLSERQFASLEKSVLGLAGKTAQAPQTLAEGLYDLVSSGFKGKEALTVLEASATAATAGLTDTATSVKAVAAVLNAYHRPASDAKQISDDLFQTVNLGVVSFEELAQNIGDVLPFATALHIGLKQVGAATATMTKAGVSAPETMTRIKGAMTALIKPTDQLKVVFKHLGVATGEELVRKAGSFQAALEAISHAVGGNKEAMAKLFPDIRGFGGALLLTGKNAKGAAGDLRGLKDDAGATSNALKEQAKSLTYQWHKFKAEVSAITIRVAFSSVDWLSKAKKDVSDFIKKTKVDFERSKNDMRDTGLTWGRSLQLGFNLAKSSANAALGFIKGQVRTAGGIVKTLAGIVTLNFGGAWRGVKQTAGGALDQIKAGLGLLPAPVKSVGNAILSSIGGAFSSVLGTARNLLGIIGDLKSSAGGDAGGSLSSAINKLADKARQHATPKPKGGGAKAHGAGVSSDISADDLAAEVLGGGTKKSGGSTKHATSHSTSGTTTGHARAHAPAKPVRGLNPFNNKIESHTPSKWRDIRMRYRQGQNRPTKLDALQATQARAELSGTLSDDMAATRSQIKYWEGRLSAAKKSKNPRAIRDAAEGLGAARAHLKELQDRRKEAAKARADKAAEGVQTVADQQLEDLQFGLKAAGVTEDLGDDITAQTAIVSFFDQQLKGAKTPEAVRAAQVGLREANLDLTVLQNQAQKDNTDALKALREAIEQQNDYAKQVTAVSLREVWRVVGDTLSGQVGGKVAQRAQTAGSGVGVRY